MRQALILMLGSRFAALIVMAVSFALLGRLLPPEAFGHFAVAIGIFGLAEVVVQLGLRQLVISRETPLSRQQIASAAGLSLFVAVLLSGSGVLAYVFLTGWLLSKPLGAALVPLSLALLVGPFLLGTEAQLHRAMRFGLISVLDLVRVLTDAAVAVLLAVLGFGVVSLATGVLVSHVVVGSLLLVCSGPELRIRPRAGGWGEFLTWGGRMTAIQTLPKAVDLSVISVLSVLQGAMVLGLFNRAQTIHQILDRALLEGIKPVILPALSHAMREGIEPTRIYRLKLDYLTALCWPSFALIALLADSLVAALLGPDWDAAVPTVQILALMGLGMPSTKMSQKLFVALGETQGYLRLEFLRSCLRVPLAAAGALISLEAFAAAYVLGSWIKAIGIAGYLHRRLGPRTGAGIVALRGAVITAATLFGPVLILEADLSAAGRLAAALPLAALGWLLAAAAIGHPVIGELLGLVRQTLRAGRRGPARRS